MRHSVFVLEQLSYLREGGMAHRWARRRPASVSVATGTSHPAVPDFRPAACCHRFSACCLLLLLFNDFHLRLSDVGWPSLVWLRERTFVANIDQCVTWEWGGKSRETWGVGFVGHQFWLVLPMLSWASSEMNPWSRIFLPRSGLEWRKKFKMISSTSFLTFLPTIFLACCATAVDKCGEGQVADHQNIRTSDHQIIRSSEHQIIRSPVLITRSSLNPHNMLKCQERLQIFHLMFATFTTNMTTWYVPTLWLAEKSIFSRIVPALMPQHRENITRIIEHIKHILCTTINPQNTRGGYAFAGRAIIPPFTLTFFMEACHSALNTISPNLSLSHSYNFTLSQEL